MFFHSFFLGFEFCPALLDNISIRVPSFNIRNLDSFLQHTKILKRRLRLSHLYSDSNGGLRLSHLYRDSNGGLRLSHLYSDSNGGLADETRRIPSSRLLISRVGPSASSDRVFTGQEPWAIHLVQGIYALCRQILKRWILPCYGLLRCMRWFAWPLKLGPILSPETSVSNLTPRNNPEDGRF